MGEVTVDALRGVDFVVPQGQFVAIMGPSGAGKSTLLHLIGGLDTPSDDDVLLGGKRLAYLSDDEITIMRRRQVGFIFQFYNLLTTPGGEMSGAHVQEQGRERVALFSAATDGATVAGGVEYDVTTGGECGHLLTGVLSDTTYLEGKPTHVIAWETSHSPEAVDHYTVNLARVYFAVVQRGMTLEEAAFVTQQPLGIVRQYIRLIEELDLDFQQVYARSDVQLSKCDGDIKPSLVCDADQNERREQEPIAG